MKNKTVFDILQSAPIEKDTDIKECLCNDNRRILLKDDVVISRQELNKLRNLEINYNDTYEHYIELTMENDKLKKQLEDLRKRLNQPEYKCQEYLNKIMQDSPYLMSKLIILYEINCRLDLTVDDVLIDKIYRAYLDNSKYINGVDYVDAIYNWCIEHETNFDLIDDYDKMLSEL